MTAVPAPTLPFTAALLACLLAGALPSAAAAGQRLVLANLSLPDSVWPSQRDAVIELLQQAQPSVIVVQDVVSHGAEGPTVCELARQMRMHCDFVSADPPRSLPRQGAVLMSALPLQEDGASLLHGGAHTPAVAAGYLAMNLPSNRIAVYSASLAPGADQLGNRVRQAADLRRWMASHAPAQVTLVCARFASSPSQLALLMPGFATARSKGGATASHGLDVLYRPTQARLVAATTLRLATPSTPPVDGRWPAANAQEQLLGVLVELALPATTQP